MSRESWYIIRSVRRRRLEKQRQREEKKRLEKQRIAQERYQKLEEEQEKLKQEIRSGDKELERLEAEIKQAFHELEDATRGKEQWEALSEPEQIKLCEQPAVVETLIEICREELSDKYKIGEEIRSASGELTGAVLISSAGREISLDVKRESDQTELHVDMENFVGSECDVVNKKILDEAEKKGIETRLRANRPKPPGTSGRRKLRRRSRNL